MATMLHFVIARTEACPNQRTVLSLPHSAVSPEDSVASVLHSLNNWRVKRWRA